MLWFWCNISWNMQPWDNVILVLYLMKSSTTRYCDRVTFPDGISHKIWNYGISVLTCKCEIFLIWFNQSGHLVTLLHIRQITILGIAAYFVSCVTSITEMSPVTRMSKPTRERSRGDLRAQRVVCGESTPGPYHYHQHQEASAISYHVTYLTMSNTNTLTNMCLCYSARRNMLDPLTSLDSIFLPIPSWSWLKRPGSMSIHVASKWGRVPT